MFDLPEGEAPFGLPSDYASIDWLDSHSARCEMDWGYADEDTCYETAYCDGEWANSTNCWRDASTATWSCSCSQSSVNFPAAVAGTSSEACRAATSLCHANLSDFGQATCADYGDDSAEYCSQRRDCSSVHTSSHGVIQKQETSRWVNCSAAESNESACYCYHGDYAYEARVDVGLPAQESCDVAMDACAGNLDEGSEEAPECVYASGSFSPQSCWRSYSCSQSASSGGVSVSRVFQQSASCDAAAEPGTWSCSCLDERLPIEVVAAEAKDACDAVVVQCVSGVSAPLDDTASPETMASP